MGKTKTTKPTLAQKKVMSAAGLIAKNWLVLKETDEELHLVSKGAGVTRKVKKITEEQAKRKRHQNRHSGSAIKKIIND